MEAIAAAIFLAYIETLHQNTHCLYMNISIILIRSYVLRSFKCACVQIAMKTKIDNNNINTNINVQEIERIEGSTRQQQFEKKQLDVNEWKYTCIEASVGV